MKSSQALHHLFQSTYSQIQVAFPPATMPYWSVLLSKVSSPTYALGSIFFYLPKGLFLAIVTSLLHHPLISLHRIIPNHHTRVPK